MKPNSAIRHARLGGGGRFRAIFQRLINLLILTALILPPTLAGRAGELDEVPGGQQQRERRAGWMCESWG
jgi:hypothetical protein